MSLISNITILKKKREEEREREREREGGRESIFASITEGQCIPMKTCRSSLILMGIEWYR